MKKIYNKLMFVSQIKFNSLLLVAIGSMFATNMWAAFSFFDNNTGDVQYYEEFYDTKKRDGSKDDYSTGTYWLCESYGCNRTSDKYINKGSVKSLYLKQWFAQVWKKDGADITDVHFDYYVNSSSGSSNADKSKTTTWSDGGTTNQKWMNTNTNINVLDLVDGKPGSYELYCYFKLWGKESGAGSDSEYDSDWGGNHKFRIGFTIPGFKDNTTSITSTQSDVQVNTPYSWSIPYTHYGDKPDEVVVSRNDNDIFTISSKPKSNGIDVSCKPAAAYVNTQQRCVFTVKDKYGKSVEITVIANIVPQTPVVLNAKNPVEYIGPDVELSGYLKSSGCDKTLRTCGFFYCLPASEGASCTPTSSSYNVEISRTTTLKAGDSFVKRFAEDKNHNRLVANRTYYYKSYVKNGSNTITLSTETGTFKTEDKCVYAAGDTVYYTVDASQDEDYCLLRYKSIAAAVEDMKSNNRSHTTKWLDNKFLTKPVVIEVAPGEYGDLVNNTTWISDLAEINDANNGSPSSAPSYRLIIRAKNGSDRENLPVFKGGISLVNARYVTLKDLKITRQVAADKSNHEYSAIEIGYTTADNNDYNSLAAGALEKCDIEILNCIIDATAFTCIHAAGVDNLTISGCDFTMASNADAGHKNNAKFWGASVKLIGCKNVKFIRNSLKGSHATLLWLQHTQRTLVMNNVFWNDNLFEDNVAFIRPLMMNTGSSYEITNLGIYYNTFYLADRCTMTKSGNSCTSSSSDEKVDFFRLGGSSSTGGASQAGYTDQYKVDKIHFMYNNCYSYDVNIKKCNEASTAFFSKTMKFCTNNNFWGEGDDNKTDPSKSSLFAFGSNTKHVNVPDLVCKSTADNPDALIIKGPGLNLGTQPGTDISEQGIATTTLADRFHDVVRSTPWTYGAFQQSTVSEVNEIIWTGKDNSQWDNRSNWKTVDGDILNCAHSLSADLKVVIPDGGSVKNIPQIPAWGLHSSPEPTNDNERGKFPSEYVEAGLAAVGESSPTKYAAVLDLQDGAAIKGVENLYDNSTLRYESATMNFTAVRKQWILVGGVIKPFKSGTSGPVREIQSGDFFIENWEPHVYMQEFKDDGTGYLVPGTPFTSKETDVEPNKSFGIFIPDQYGPYKLPAEIYYSGTDKVNDGNLPKTYPPFVGRFAYDGEDKTSSHVTSAGLPKYTLGAVGSYIFANNSYPANLDLTELVSDYSASGVSAQYYNTESKGWDSVDGSETEHIKVKPQIGFALTSSTTANVVVSVLPKHYVGGTTKSEYKRASADTYLKLTAVNTADNTSTFIRIRYEGGNVSKAFSYNESTPELFVPGDGESKFSIFGIDDVSVEVPLGVRNKTSKKETVQFVLGENSGFESIILVDRSDENREYNLSDGQTPYFSDIAPGDCIGRFYLKLNYVDGEPIIPTEIEDIISSGDSGIGIFAYNKELTVSAPANMSIDHVTLYDMAGRSFNLPVNGTSYCKYHLNVSSGFYTVQVIADKTSETKKIVVK